MAGTSGNVRGKRVLTLRKRPAASTGRRSATTTPIAPLATWATRKSPAGYATSSASTARSAGPAGGVNVASAIQSEAINNAWKEEGLCFLPIRASHRGPSCNDADSDATAAARSPLEKLLATDHLLLPADIGERARSLGGAMVVMMISWNNSDDELAEMLIDDFFAPVSKAALRYVEEGHHLEALGELLGLLLFASSETCWLHMPKDWLAYDSLFNNLSRAWRAVLKQSDETLNLAPKGGLQGGYRQPLESLVYAWEHATNKKLASLRSEAPASSDSSNGQCPQLRIMNRVMSFPVEHQMPMFTTPSSLTCSLSSIEA